MTRISAGILLYRRRGEALEVLLVHPGGPFFGKKDFGNWSIPKGEVSEADPDYQQTARREFLEEVGHPVPPGRLIDMFERGTILLTDTRILARPSTPGLSRATSTRQP